MDFAKRSPANVGSPRADLRFLPPSQVPRTAIPFQSTRSMNLSRRLLFALAWVWMCGLAGAAPPHIDRTSFSGAQRGVAAELEIKGSNLSGNPRLIAGFAFQAEPISAKPGDAATWSIKLTPAATTAVGVHQIRVQSDEGVSNPLLFAIGQVQQVPEKEDNSTFSSAQAVEAPCVVEGQAPGNDVDYFKFRGVKGDRIVIDAMCSRIGSSIDPEIRLTTAGRKFVAAADDSLGLAVDARLTAVLPEDGEYVVELADSRYQGGDRPIYRLTIGAIPVAEEVYPLGGQRGEVLGLEFRGGTLPAPRVGAQRLSADAAAQADRLRLPAAFLGLSHAGDPSLDVETRGWIELSSLSEVLEPEPDSSAPPRTLVPAVLNGRIDPEGDEDRFTVVGVPGQSIKISVRAASLGSALDARITVFGAKGAKLGEADDAQSPPPGPNLAQLISPDPSIIVTVPQNPPEVTIAIRDLVGRGGIGYAYRIIVEPNLPAPALALPSTEIAVPKGGSALLSVTRGGDAGPLVLSALNPPAGLSVTPGMMSQGQNQGVITLTAAKDAQFQASQLTIVGKKPNDDTPHVAVATIIFAKQENMATNLEHPQGVFVAPATAAPVALEAPSAPIEIVHGYSAQAVIKASRGEKGAGALAISALPGPLPPGITIAAATIAEKAGETPITLSASTDAPMNQATIGLVAKGKIDGQDLTLAIPGVTIAIARPAELALDRAKVEIKSGQTVEIKGKFTRRSPFAEPATIQLKGLPAGLKADPVKVEPGAGEFTLKLVADAKIAAAKVNANATASFQINKKDYSNTTPAPLAVEAIP